MGALLLWLFGTLVRGWPALVVSLAVVVGACETQAPRVYTTGVEGHVTLGPMCPVQRQDQPCPDRPYEASLVVRSLDRNEVVASAMSGPDGAYRIPLAPGGYVIVPSSPDGGVLPRAAPAEVQVPSDGFVTVDIAFDTGIR